MSEILESFWESGILITPQGTVVVQIHLTLKLNVGCFLDNTQFNSSSHSLKDAYNTTMFEHLFLEKMFFFVEQPQ